MNFLLPDWPAPSNVRAVTTLRTGGVSAPPFDSLNLASHVGDDPGHVTENRRRLRAELHLACEPFWLEQVHGTRVVRVGDEPGARQADAAITNDRDQICAVLTADCLPVLFATTDGRKIGVAHAGWRGLAAGVLEATFASLATPPRELMAWLGPAISQEHFEVGDEVRASFLRIDPAAAAAFVASARGRWRADLYRLARQHLNRMGIDAIYGGGRCTFRERDAFFSHRRDDRCGRMATLIWLDSSL